MIPAGETLRLAGIALTRNKMRSFLTALGIIIGVGAVIFMQSIGEGAKSRVRAQIEGAGTNIVMLFSGTSQGPGGRGGQGSQPTITWEDMRAIQTDLPSVAAVAPQMNSSQPVISESNTWNTQITGTTPDFFTIRNWPVSSGAMFTASDQAGAAKNAVIGQTAAENLFGPGVDPIGQIIRIRDAPFTKLDLIGINAFYPLAENEGASPAELAEGGRKVAASIEALARDVGKPVVLTEVGYTTRPDPAVKPWEWPDGMKDVKVDERAQAEAYRALLAPFLDARWCAGFFVWRFYADPDDVSQEAEWGFSPRGKLAELVMRDAFTARWATDPWGPPGDMLLRTRARTPGVFGWTLAPELRFGP